VVLGFELRNFMLAPPVHFALVIFGDGGLENYLPRLDFNLGPPDLASQVARLTGVSHQC
jgi:hypothetical protein